MQMYEPRENRRRLMVSLISVSDAADCMLLGALRTRQSLTAKVLVFDCARKDAPDIEVSHAANVLRISGNILKIVEWKWKLV